MKKRIRALLLAMCMLLCLVPTPVGAMTMYVDLAVTGAATLQLELESGDSIGNIKDKIQAETGIPSGKQALYFNGRLLDNGRSLMDYNIQKLSTLTLALKDPVEVGTAAQLAAALADEKNTYFKLTADIAAAAPMPIAVIDTAVLLDLNGYVLQFAPGSGAAVTLRHDLAVEDSRPDATHADTALPKGGVIDGSGREQAVYIEAENTLRMTGGTVRGAVYNLSGTITGGTFENTVYCYGGQITDGTFKGAVTARDRHKELGAPDYDYIHYEAFIQGGTFTETSAVSIEGGHLDDGTFQGQVTVDGSNDDGTLAIGDINGGTFTETSVVHCVYGENLGCIRTGVFAGTVYVTDGGHINAKNELRFADSSVVYVRSWLDGGEYYGTVHLEPNGRINSGTFYGTLHQNGGVYSGGYHTVQFDPDGGSGVDAQSVIPGQKATRPAVPVKNGYTFMGWYNGDGRYDFSAPVTQPLTLRAKWAQGITGAGTDQDPYRISTAEGLAAFRDAVNSGQWDACAVLEQDIILNDGTFDDKGNFTPTNGTDPRQEWSPIGLHQKQSPYSGTFDGAGHTVYGLYADDSTPAKSARGLFGYLDGATVKNVTVTGYIDAILYKGGIAGYAKNSTVTGCRNLATITQPDYGLCEFCAGGIVGLAEDNCVLADCTNEGRIAAFADSDFAYAGGIVGMSYSSRIRGCANTGTVTGGLVGDMVGYSHAGGIAALVSGTRITDCYNVGTITGTGNSADLRLGGLVGSYVSGALKDSYNAGAIIADAAVCRGSIAARIDSDIENCYYLTGTADRAVGQDAGAHQIGALAKSVADFADGSVLADLIHERESDAHPWAEACQYLAVTGRTQPVFRGQGDAHTHSGDWQFDESGHWRACACGVVFDRATHSGTDDGDCRTAVVCVCGYEITAARADHTFGSWAPGSDGTHTRHCTVADCTAGTETAPCTDENQDHKCDICSAVLSTCKDDNQDHKCDVCGAVLSTCADENQDHKCDVCGAVLSTCADENRDGKCDLCGKALSDTTGTTVRPKTDPAPKKQPVQHSNTKKSPQTGATDPALLWLALLFIGSACTVCTIKRKKSHLHGGM